MTILTARHFASFLAFIFLAWAVPHRIAAQVQQATSVASSDLGCVLVICGSVTNKPAAVDGQVTTAAVISPPLTVGSAALRVGFASTVPVGATVTVTLSFSGGVLNLGLVNQTFIRTYNSLAGAVQQDIPLGSALNITVLTNNTMTAEFAATAAFTQLELRTGSLVAVNAGYAVQLYQVTATVDPLPVELVSFTGKTRAATVELGWETASEYNSAYFLVERSTEPQQEFRTIGRVAAAGNSMQHAAYRFVDAQPAALNYYRLRQVDKDGTSTYSPVVAVKATPALVLQAYPNPTTGVLTVTGPVNTHFALVNRLGQVVQRGELALAQTCQLDFRNQPDGLYFLREQATGTTVNIMKAGGSLSR